MIDAKETLTGVINETKEYVYPDLQEKEVTPIEEAQEIVPDEDYYGLSKVSVERIPEEYIVPTGNLDITENGDYDVTEYASVNVNKPGIVPTGTLSINKNGIYDVTEYAGADVNVRVIEPELKDVNFFNHDGTLLYSYTKNEFLALESMPEFAENVGLTAQAWNWSFEGAKTYVRKYGVLNVGQVSTTDDGSTRIYIDLSCNSPDRLNPYLNLGVNGSVTIDFGDDTESQAVTGSTTDYNTIHVQHIYERPGKYVITITPNTSETQISFNGVSNRCSCLTNYRGSASTSPVTSSVYFIYSIYKIEFGPNVAFNGYAFAYCCNLKIVSISNEAKTFTNASQLFANCYNLKAVIMPTNIRFPYLSWFSNSYAMQVVCYPETIASLPTFTHDFSNQYNLRTLTIPEGMTNLSSSFLNACYNIIKFVVPSSVTSLSSYFIVKAHSLKILDFRNSTQVVSIGSSSFNETSDDLKIVVPDDLYESWKTTSNWSSVASKIVKASEFTE